jgi:hypothetical protein
MPRMYIANGTSQRQRICYRLPETAKLIYQDIDPGKQVSVGGNNRMLNEIELGEVIKQLTPYGLLNVTEFKGSRGVVPYLYNLDNPVTGAIFNRLLDHNTGVLVVTGAELRKTAAIAVNQVVDAAVAASNRAATNKDDYVEPANKISVEIDEDDSSSTIEGERIKEGFNIDRSGPSARMARQGKRANA